MNRLSPTIEGFRALFRRPSLGTAEIAWRWSYGTALVVLVAASILEYLDTLPVNNADLFLLSTRHPLLVSRAINDILRGSTFRFVMAATVLALALTGGWILLASLARGAIVRSVLEYLQSRYEEAGFTASVSASKRRLGPIFTLNFLRAVVSLTAVAGCVGAFILGSLVSTDKDPEPLLAFLLVSGCLAMVWLIWSTLNWYLSLAAIFVVRDAADSLGALSLAVGQFRERAGPFFAVGFWFGIAHLTALFIATSAVGFPLAFAGLLPFGVVFAGVAIVTLLYFAVVDWLYAGRLAAYVAIIAAPPFVPETIVVTIPPTPREISGVVREESAQPVEMRDVPSMSVPYPPIPPSDDDILSDVPELRPPDEPENQ
jgi:hypothetical protein